MRKLPDLLRSRARTHKAGAARREGRGDSRMRRNTHTHKRRHNPADERRPRFDENHATAFRVIRKQRQETVASGSVRDVDFIGYQRAGLSYPVYANTHEEGRRRRGRGGDQKNEEKVGGHVSFEFRPGMHSDARRTHNYYYGGPIYFIRTATHT